MNKRHFRQRPSAQGERPSYPTTESFERSDRRRFLARLGGTLLGAGALASGLAACGGRSVKTEPDQGHMMGEAPQPDAGVDTLKPDALEPDMTIEGGVAPPPPAPADAGPEWTVEGDVTQPDAAVDSISWAGGKPGPGTKLDGG
jgi:hypothetical protein